MIFDFLRVPLLKKRKTRNLLLEALKNANIPCVYNDDEKKFSYIDANGGDILTAFKVDGGYKMNGDIISEADVYERFLDLYQKERTIISFLNNPKYEGFFKCAQMLDFFAEKTNLFDIDIETSDDKTEIYALMSTKTEAIKILAQKGEKLRCVSGDKKTETPESIALDLFSLIYNRYRAYFENESFDIKELAFPYKEIIERYIESQKEKYQNTEE